MVCLLLTQYYNPLIKGKKLYHQILIRLLGKMIANGFQFIFLLYVNLHVVGSTRQPTYQELAAMQNKTSAQNERAREKRINREYIVVSTNHGKMRGYRVKPHEFTIYHRETDLVRPKAVDCFMGIPFAKPPVGKLRYQSPQPIEPFAQDMVYNATSLPNSCPQPIDTYFGEDFLGTDQWNTKTPISEDCLYLNIWTPAPRPENQKLAVLVWIYGGSFASGTITLKLYDGKIMASRFNVIIISINYRLGSFGFLFTNDPIENPGNAGILDQLVALKWIKRNVEFFGGDPDRITVMGESAGAVSIAFLLLSPQATPYINRVILQSSAINNPWGLIERKEAVSRAYKLAAQFECSHATDNKFNTTTAIEDQFDAFQPPTEDDGKFETFYEGNDPSSVANKFRQLRNSRKALNCLRAQNYTEIIDKDYLVASDAMDFPFAPVIDGNILKAHPSYLSNMGLFKKVDVLLGSNINEGTAFLVYYLDKIFSPLRENVTLTAEELRWAVDKIYFKFNPVARQAVKFHYDVWEDPNNIDAPMTGGLLSKSPDPLDSVKKVENMAGDYWFICSVNEFADLYSQAGQNVYMYRFRHRSSQNVWPKWMGVMHGDEISFMFGEPLKIGSRFSEEERDLSYTMMRFWTNFAKHGDPNKNGEYDWTGIRWPTYASGKECLELDIRMNKYDFNLTRGPRLRNCAFQKYLLKLQKNTEKLKLQSATCPGPSITKKISQSTDFIPQTSAGSSTTAIFKSTNTHFLENRAAHSIFNYLDRFTNLINLPHQFILFLFILLSALSWPLYVYT